MRRALVLVVVAACAPVRFVDRGVVWQAHDDRPIPSPAPTPPAVDWSALRDTVFQPADRVLKLDYGVEARNVNALDEAPESSWFHDPRRDSPAARLRPRPLTDAEMTWGAAGPGDVPVLPLFVAKSKTVGATPGFVARDARGVRYMIKLDPPGRPFFATSVEVVVSRLAWASGFLVPKEVMMELAIDDVKIAPGATLKDEWDQSRPFSPADLQRLLDKAARTVDGKVPLLASRWLPGVNLGPFKYFGRRLDDPNDRVPHEDRRELRGFGVFSAWVNNVDTLENNNLDMYDGGHVVHYAQDVGGAFAVWTAVTMRYWMGHETYFDVPHIFRALLTLGFSSGYWEEQRFQDDFAARDVASPELGAFDADHFDPRSWRPNLPNAAFARQTTRDRYWAAKRIALIDARELKAAIAAGHYPAGVDARLFDILWQRREKLLRAFLADETALDHFRLDGARLCFDDLWRRAGLAGVSRLRARAGKRLLAIVDMGEGVGCVDATGAGYRVLELAAWRDGKASHPVRVHLLGDRVLGVER
jgi:hypothetical protein